MTTLENNFWGFSRHDWGELETYAVISGQNFWRLVLQGKLFDQKFMNNARKITDLEEKRAILDSLNTQ